MAWLGMAGPGGARQGEGSPLRFDPRLGAAWPGEARPGQAGPGMARVRGRPALGWGRRNGAKI